MKEIKKYTKVVRYGKGETIDVLKQGDIISITEKIDGANASFRIDNTNDLGVSCYSRNNLLDEHNTLGGFYNWVRDNIIPTKQLLNPNYIYFGEWLIKHKVVYKEEYYNNFYLFSIYDVEKEEYLSDEIVIEEARRLNLKTVEYFYYGEFKNYNQLKELIGKSNITETKDTGEGIVVKNVSYRDKFGKQLFVKLVSDRFAEVQKQKNSKNSTDNEITILVKEVVTKARIEKILFKLTDENKLKQDYAIKDMGTILKLLIPIVYEDVMDEESDMFVNYEEDKIRKTISKVVPSITKEILKEQNRA